MGIPLQGRPLRRIFSIPSPAEPTLDGRKAAGTIKIFLPNSTQGRALLMLRGLIALGIPLCLLLTISAAQSQPQNGTGPIVLHASRLLDIEAGRILQPGEVLVEGERIRESGVSVSHPAGAQVIDLGDTTLMPGMIDAHVHLFLHPGAEDLQTVEESV